MTALVAILLLASVLVGQAPRTFKELRAQIDNAKTTTRLIAAIGELHRFKTSAARDLLCKGLDIYRDPAVRSAVFRQMVYHPHVEALSRLEQGFNTSRYSHELDGIITGLSGQGRRGQIVLEIGLTSTDRLRRSKAIAGLRKVKDKRGATLALISAYGKADIGTKIQILTNVVAIGSKGGTGAEVQKLVFKILAKETEVTLRVVAMRALRGKSSPRILSLLRREFEQRKSSRLVSEAALGLATLDRPGLSVLLRGLQSKQQGHRDAALAALGAAGENRIATQALIERYREVDARMQLLILTVLGRHELIPALTALRIRALESKSAKIRAAALAQLATAEYRLVASRALELARDPEIRKDDRATAQVFYALGTVLTRRGLPVFLDLGRKRGWIADSHWNLLLKKNPRPVLALLSGSALALDDAKLRLVATLLLAKVKGRSLAQAEDGLLRALRDKSPLVVVTAMRALIRQRNKRVLPILSANLESMDEDVRVQAMLGMHEFKGKSMAWGARLMRILHNSTGATRLVAMDLLAKLKLRPALGAVRALFVNQAWQVRSAAYYFCLQVRDKASIAPLIARLDQEDGRLKAEVIGTLRALTNLSYRESSQWRRWWDQQGRRFELPPLGKKAGVGRSAPSATTYYSMPLSSNRVCFLVDTSGSMLVPAGTSAGAGAGKRTRLDVAKKALSEVIEKCGEGFHFNVIHFGGSASRWKRELRPATVNNRAGAKQYVAGIRAGGATNFFEALLMAFQDESVDTIYLLSDGAPTVGDITNQQELGDEVQRWNAKRLILIHTISIGSDSAIMKRLAEDSGGTHVFRR